MRTKHAAQVNSNIVTSIFTLNPLNKNINVFYAHTVI